MTHTHLYLATRTPKSLEPCFKNFHLFHDFRPFGLSGMLHNLEVTWVSNIHSSERCRARLVFCKGTTMQLENRFVPSHEGSVRF